jgi:hypothetical protein
MNVYDLWMDSSDQWVRFFTLDNLALPQYKDSRAFFDAQPLVRIDRNTEATPRGSKARLGDYSNVGYAPYPCFSARAKKLLGPHIDGLGQWLALECDEAPYWLFNITHVFDALDEQHSELAHFTDGGVMAIDSFVFRPERLRGQLMFKVPQCPAMYRLVTQDFVDLVREHQLTGFMFKQLWSSETGPVSAKLKDWEKPRITGLEQQ